MSWIRQLSRFRLGLMTVGLGATTCLPRLGQQAGTESSSAAALGSSAPGIPGQAPSPATEPTTAASPAEGVTPDARLPEVQSTELPNGFSVHLARQKDCPLVHLRLVVRSGSVSDAAKPGLARLTAAEMLAGGAGGMSRGKYRTRVHELGARLRAKTTLDATWFELQTAPEDAVEAISILSALARSPGLSVADWSRARQREIQLARHRADEGSGQRARDVARSRLYALPTAVHPYATAEVTVGELEALRFADVRRWYRTHVTPKNAMLIVVGDVDLERLKTAAEAAFAELSGTAPVQPSFVDPVLPSRTAVELIDRPKASHSTVVVGVLAPALHADSSAAAEIALDLLTDEASGRIAERLLEGGWAEQTQTLGRRVAHGPQPVMVQTRTLTCDTAFAIDATLGEFARLSREPPPNWEVAAAARQLSTKLWSSAETAEGVASLLQLQQLGAMPADYFEQRPRLWRTVTPEDVRVIAELQFAPKHACVAVVGDAARIERALSRFGPVQVRSWDHPDVVHKRITHNPSAPLAIPAK